MKKLKVIGIIIITFMILLSTEYAECAYNASNDEFYYEHSYKGTNAMIKKVLKVQGDTVNYPEYIDIFKVVGLTDINLPWEYKDTVRTVNISDNIEFMLDDETFDYNNLETINIGSGLKTISGQCGLYNGNSHNEILNEYGFTILETGSITYERTPFGDFPALKNINVSENNRTFSSIDGALCSKDKTKLIFVPNGKTGKYIIPESITTLDYPNLGGVPYEDYPFCRCDKITELIIHDNVINEKQNLSFKMIELQKVYVGNKFEFSAKSFWDCINLKEITVGADHPQHTAYDGALYSKDGTVFEHCPQGKEGSFHLKQGTEIVDEYAFMDSKLSDVYIPSSVTSIAEYAFAKPGADFLSNNTKITDIYIPSSVTDIHYKAFLGCEDRIIIHSPKGSYAHEYATKNNINWVEAEPIVTAEYTDGKVIADVEYLPIRTDLEPLPGEPPIIDSQKLYIAVYNTRNQLVKYFTQNVWNGEYSFDVSNIPGAYKVKAMLWNDTDDLTPLCPAATAYVN